MDDGYLDGVYKDRDWDLRENVEKNYSHPFIP